MGGGPSFGELIALGVAGSYLAATFLSRVMYLLAVQRCLRAIHPRNRRIQPALVWLDLIPCFNLYWGFVVVVRLADSLSDEFYDRRLDVRGEDYGRSMGVAFMSCTLFGYALSCVYVGYLLLLPAFVVWIMYWVKIVGYRKELERDGDTDYGEYDGDG